MPEYIIAEPRLLTPDKFLSLRATELLQQIPGQPLSSDLLPALLSELDGFKGSPDMLTGIMSHADHWFQLGLDPETIACEGVSYDPVGLVGLKYDSPKFQAVVIQPDDEGDGLCRIHIVADGVRHEYKMVGGELMIGFEEKLPETSRTYQMLAHLGVDVGKMDS